MRQGRDKEAEDESDLNDPEQLAFGGGNSSLIEIRTCAGASHGGAGLSQAYKK